MAIPQGDAERSWSAARFHVQIELVERPSKPVMRAPVPIRGRVVRVFRGHDSIHPGDPLTFQLDICPPGDLPPPGAAHASYDALLHASHMEVFLNGTPPNCDLVTEGWTVLSDLSHDPVLIESDAASRASEAGAAGRRAWWRFWS